MLVGVRRNAQHLELKLLESTLFVLNNILMVTASTCGPTDCLVSTPPLHSQNVHSHKNNHASHRARGETSNMSFVLDANREGNERVNGKASRTQSSRMRSGSCVYARTHSLMS